jgi:hypothetical protein
VTAVGRLGARLPAGTGDALSLWFTMRLGLGLVAAWLVLHGGVPGPCHFELARNNWLTLPPIADQGPAFPLVGVWQRWDACWYSKIATYGYEPQELSVTFWPAFPILMGLVARLLGGAVALAGLVVSGVAYIGAMIGLRRLVTRDVNEPVARWTVLLVTLFPTAFYLFAPFTEALFLCLAVWTIVGARERRWGLTLLVGCVAALTRIQGLFLALPIGWEALAAAGLLAWRPWRRPLPPRPDWRELLPGVGAALGPMIGFVAFLVFTNAIAGKTPLDTQDAWGGREFRAPWDVISASWTWAFEHQDPTQLLNIGTLVVFAVGLIPVAFKLPFSYLLYGLPQVLLLSTRLQPTPLTSTARYLLVVFPVFVIVAMLPWQRVRIAWAIVSTLLLGLLVFEFQHGTFIA